MLRARSNIPREATVAETQAPHEEVVENCACDIPHNVTCPLLPSNTLTNGRLEMITDFEFKDGGRMVHDSKLRVKDSAQMTELLSTLVVFSDACLHDNMTAAHKKATEALADIVNKFCKGSRADNGEHLKKRALRHALDPKSPPLDCGGTASAFRHNDKVGLVVSQSIRPSFRQRC